jgi:hypothetical protein
MEYAKSSFVILGVVLDIGKRGKTRARKLDFFTFERALLREKCQSYIEILDAVLNMYIRKLSISLFVSFDFPIFRFVNVIGISVTFAL